jgi:hypothetical protein
MIIRIKKSRTIQINEFEPYNFEYELQDDIAAGTIKEAKKMMGDNIDTWIEEETKKVLNAKKLKENHGILPPVGKSDEPF